MTSKDPFQPKAFYDSMVILVPYPLMKTWNVVYEGQLKLKGKESVQRCNHLWNLSVLMILNDRLWDCQWMHHLKQYCD